MKKKHWLYILMLCSGVLQYTLARNNFMARQEQIKRLDSLCQKDEALLFTCHIGGKIASICSKGDSVHYIFGSHNKVELKYPNVPENSKAKFFFQKFYNEDFTQTFGEAVRFQNNNTDYIIYRLSDDYALSIMENSKEIAKLKCDPQKTIIYKASDMQSYFDEDTQELPHIFVHQSKNAVAVPQEIAEFVKPDMRIIWHKGIPLANEEIAHLLVLQKKAKEFAFDADKIRR